MKKVVIIVIVLAILVGGFLMLRSSAPNLENISLAKVDKGSISLSVSGTGNVISKNSVNISAKSSAKYVEVLFKTGDTVKSGDVIAKLDKFDLEKAVKSAEYSFNSAVYAKKKLEASPLSDENSLKQAQQQINVASVQLDIAKNNLNNNSVIVSPINGIITTLNAKVGEYASVTLPVVSIQDPNNIEVLINVNEIDVNKLVLGQDVNVTIDAAGGVKLGKVSRIESLGVNLNGVINYPVRVELTDKTNVKLNMSVNAEVLVTKKDNVLRVPSGSLKTKNGQTSVQIVKNSSKLKDPKTLSSTVDLESIVVKTGLNDNSYVEILEGLKEGDEVVTLISKVNPLTGN
jgi:HlyD family secretion protein